jgi:GntR family transcriptional regulator/MocR family aminotransferase
LEPGVQLPSTRALSEQLKVARGTVVEAYEQLAAEGWIKSRPGARATVVALAGATVRKAVIATDRPDRIPRHNLEPGSPDVAMFPMSAWLSALRRVARTTSAEALGYGDPRGHPELRSALAAYLARARGVVSDQVVVCSGIAEGLSAVGVALVRIGAIQVAVEDPCLPYFREILARTGLKVRPVAVDHEGIMVDALERADAVFVTPAHQYPLGMTLSPRRRAALLRWAHRTEGFIIEDDYDAEFRFDRQPIHAMQGLDPDRVIHLGTTSKSLAPGLRLGWVALPEVLVEPFLKGREWRLPTPGLDQLAFAELITSGGFDRHLRRARAVYRQRRQAVIQIVPPHIKVLGLNAGLHAVLELPPGGPPEVELLAAAERNGVRVSGLAVHWSAPTSRQGLVVGYARPAAHQFGPALAALASVLSASQ